MVKVSAKMGLGTCTSSGIRSKSPRSRIRDGHRIRSRRVDVAMLLTGRCPRTPSMRWGEWVDTDLGLPAVHRPDHGGVSQLSGHNDNGLVMMVISKDGDAGNVFPGTLSGILDGVQGPCTSIVTHGVLAPEVGTGERPWPPGPQLKFPEHPCYRMLSRSS